MAPALVEAVLARQPMNEPAGNTTASPTRDYAVINLALVNNGAAAWIDTQVGQRPVMPTDYG